MDQLYVITFEDAAVISALPVSPDADVLGSSQRLITTIDNAIAMLGAIGVDTGKLTETPL